MRAGANVSSTPISHLGWVLFDPGLEDPSNHFGACGDIGLVASECIYRLDHLPPQSQGKGFGIFFWGCHSFLPF